MDSGAGPATTMDEGLATHQTRNHFLNLTIQIHKKDRGLSWPPIFLVTVTLV